MRSSYYRYINFRCVCFVDCLIGLLTPLLYVSALEREFAGAPEFALNLNSQEANICGWYVLKLDRFEHSDALVEAIVIMKYLPDMEDLQGENRTKVFLSECGTKLYVKEPTVSSFMTTTGIYEGAWRMLLNQPPLYQALVNAHMVSMREVDRIPDRRCRRYVLTVPVGMRLQMGFTNPNTGRQLSGKMGVAITVMNGTNDRGQTVRLDIPHPTVTYIVAIEDEDEGRILRNDPTIGNEFIDFFTNAMHMNP